jgi:hypothetical protein
MVPSESAPPVLSNVCLRPLNCMLPGPFNVPEIWHCTQISKKKKGVNDPLKHFLHLKMLKSAPKCPKLIPEIIKL